MKNPNPPGAAQSHAVANIDKSLELLTAQGVPEEVLREAREFLAGGPLDPFETLVADLIPGSVDEIDFEAVETALCDGFRELARSAPGSAWTPTAPTRTLRRHAAAARRQNWHQSEAWRDSSIEHFSRS